MPFLESADGNTVTLAVFPLQSWILTFKEFGIDRPHPHPKSKGWEFWDAHHLVPMTVLTHALSQGDL